jgi:hypothetical protein
MANQNHENGWPTPVILVERNRPIFVDHCRHGMDCFVTSLKILESPKRATDLDVYLFEDHGKQNVCIRTGNDGGDYASTGTILDCMYAALVHKMPTYVAAIDAIDKRFKIRAERL